jgi:predicted transcriptional regulator
MGDNDVAARRQLGELEAEVLSALAGSDVAMTPHEVQESVGGDLAYTTVATILTRLRSKDLVAREGEGRTYRYRLVVDESDLIAERMHSQLRHAHNTVGALGQFVNGLSADEEAALRQVLERLDDGT